MKKYKKEGKYHVRNDNNWYNNQCDPTWLSEMKLQNLFK